MLIDSHAHLGDDSLFPHWREILLRAKEARISSVINICTDQKTLTRGLEIQNSNPPIPVFLSAATTPHDVERDGDLFFEQVERAAFAKKIVAVGETGLDYFYEHSPKEVQKKHLIRYFQLAKSSSLPVIFHCRDAFQDLFDIANLEFQSEKAVLHCFTGTLEEAKRVLEKGWYISFSGIATFKKSTSLQDVIRYVPLERIFVETDSPYLAPQSKRGSCNEPAFVVETAQLVASLKGVSIEKLEEITSRNVQQLFSL